MQVGAAGGVSPAAAEDSPAAEAAQEQVVSVDDEDEQLAAGGDDDGDDEAGDEVDDAAEESAGPRGPKTFEELMASVDQLREAGTPLEETTAAMLLAAVSAGGHRQILTDTHVKKAKKALELIEKEELSMSNRQLQKLLTKLRQQRVLKHTHGNGANAADLACTLTDAFFSSGTAVDVDSYNLLLQVVLRHDVAKCVKVAGTMSEFPGVYANQQTFGIVIEACTRTNRLEEAIGFVNQMRKMRYSPRPVLLIKLLELCALENNAEAARVCLDILDQQAQRRGLTLDDGSVIQLANLAARTGSIELLTDINSHFGSNSSGAEPAISKSEDMVSVGITADYATMMHAARSIAVDEETIDDAYYTVEARRTNGERVSIESLNLVILACAQLGDVGRAIETFDEIERSFKLKPDVRSYDAVLQCCIKNGHALGAMSFMEEMRQQGVEIDDEAYSTMVLALAQALEAATSKQDAHDRARVLMNTLERRGATTEDGAEGEQQAGALAPSNEALVAAIRALAKQMRFKQAWEVISSMRPLGYAPTEDLIRFVKNGGKEPSAHEDVKSERRQQNSRDVAAVGGAGAHAEV